MSTKKEGDNRDLFSFRWMNFRVFEETGWIKLKPLTILIGPNNSGKSSLFYPLLILKQTLDSMDQSLRLRTKGDYVDVGSYQNLVHNYERKRRLEFEIRFRLHAFKSKGKPGSVGDYPPASIRLVFGQGKPKDKIELEEMTILDAFGRVMLRRRLTEKGTYSLKFFKSLKGSASPKTLKSIKQVLPENFLFDAADVLASSIPEVRKDGTVPTSLKKPRQKISKDIFVLVSTLVFANLAMEGLLDSITYIGPLRRHPRRFYERGGEDPFSVGTMGEFTAEILLQMKNEGSLKLLNEWIKEFGIRGEIDCLEHAPGILSVIRKTGKVRKIVTNIADTGFGVSQILPLLTQGLWMEENGIMIAEQPEIHLNPRLQSKLADFFVHVANENKTVVLETHSEHLILRLRSLVAEGEINPSDIALYFFEREGGRTTIKEIPIENNGHIDSENWPKGFFEDALQESFKLATAQIKSKGEGDVSKPR